MNSHSHVVFSEVEKRETIIFLKKYLQYDLATRQNSNLVRKCYTLKIISMLEMSNDIVNNYDFFKFLTKGSGDNCENSNIPNKPAQVKENFLSYHDKLRYYFNKVYNYNKNYEIFFYGYYPKVSLKQNIMEKAISFPAVLHKKKSNKHKATNKIVNEQQSQSKQILIFNDNEFNWRKLLLLFISVFLPINKTIRRFSKAELFLSSSILYVLSCGFTRTNLKDGFIGSKTYSTFESFKNRTDLSVEKQFMLEKVKDSMLDLFQLFDVFTDPKFWIAQFVALLCSVLVVSILFNVFVKNKFPIYESYFISLNIVSIGTFIFSLLLVPYLEKGMNIYAVLFVFVFTFYRLVYPIFSFRNLLDIKFRYAFIVYLAINSIYLPFQKHLYDVVQKITL